MKLIYIQWHGEEEHMMLVKPDHLAGAIQGRGLMNIPITIGEVPDCLVDELVKDWSESQLAKEL